MGVFVHADIDGVTVSISEETADRAEAVLQQMRRAIRGRAASPEGLFGLIILNGDWVNKVTWFTNEADRNAALEYAKSVGMRPVRQDPDEFLLDPPQEEAVYLEERDTLNEESSLPDDLSSFIPDTEYHLDDKWSRMETHSDDPDRAQPHFHAPNGETIFMEVTKVESDD